MSFTHVGIFVSGAVRHRWLTIRLTEPPIFLVSASSPFMQSLKKRGWFVFLLLLFHSMNHWGHYGETPKHL